MDEERIMNTLKIYDEIQKSIMDEYKNLLNFAENFRELMHKEKLLLPYHMNIIDELHINENGHSRILLKLLQYRNTEGEYIFLESLLKYINGKNHSSQFSRILIKNPLITQEEARIDLWVRDREGGYAIIFENKVYNAQDQEAQLSRYIDKTKTQHFDINNIFVVYLSSRGQEPEDQSWGGYKDEFNDRYINLSFRKDILAWLKSDVLPNIHAKDVYLNTAIIQYIDYLEGLFSLRTLNIQMNMNLDKIITSHFELNKFEDTTDKIKALREQIGNMQEVIDSMEAFKERLRQEIFSKWRKETESLFSELHPNEQKQFTDVSFMVDGKKVVVLINEDRSGLYCQVQYDINEAIRAIAGTWIEELKDILPEYSNDCVWKYIPCDNYDEVYNLFLKVINHIKNNYIIQ